MVVILHSAIETLQVDLGLRGDSIKAMLAILNDEIFIGWQSGGDLVLSPRGPH
jgi:hypothetical protein